MSNSDVLPLLNALKELKHAYVNLLEAGKERIEAYGGTCDPVDVMEAGDPYLKQAVLAIKTAEQEMAERNAKPNLSKLRDYSPEAYLRSCHKLLQKSRRYRTRFTPLWKFVSDITMRGSTVSAEICRELGWNPDQNVRQDLPPVNPP